MKVRLMLQTNISISKKSHSIITLDPSCRNNGFWDIIKNPRQPGNRFLTVEEYVFGFIELSG